MIFFLLLIDLLVSSKSNFQTFELLRIGDSKENPDYLGKNQDTKILLLKSAKSEKKKSEWYNKKVIWTQSRSLWKILGARENIIGLGYASPNNYLIFKTATNLVN